jgi:hypothetical protein
MPGLPAGDRSVVTPSRIAPHSPQWFCRGAPDWWLWRRCRSGWYPGWGVNLNPTQGHEI